MEKHMIHPSHRGGRQVAPHILIAPTQLKKSVASIFQLSKKYQQFFAPQLFRDLMHHFVALCTKTKGVKKKLKVNFPRKSIFPSMLVQKWSSTQCKILVLVHIWLQTFLYFLSLSIQRIPYVVSLSEIFENKLWSSILKSGYLKIRHGKVVIWNVNLRSSSPQSYKSFAVLVVWLEILDRREIMEGMLATK